LGLGEGTNSVGKISRIEGLENIREIRCGSDFNLALDDKGVVYSWGYNNYGQLGNTSKLFNPIPKPILNIVSEKVLDISCGDNFALARTAEGNVYSWGCGSHGQLGHGNSSDLSVPTKLNIDFPVKGISCGESHIGYRI
jgi:alpha-tubulin suppressor-like RCC1 family protein